LHNLAFAAGALVMALIVAFAAFQPLASAMRNHKHLRYQMNPLNGVWSLARVATEPLRLDSRILEPIGLDAQAAPASERPPLLVLVLGETARSANFSLNGYGRPTNTELEKHGAISFTNAWACGTSTAASVPCMFSQMGREAFADRKRNQENVLDVLHRAGLAVMWIDNQSGCKGVCDRIPNINLSATKHPTLCEGGECLDGIMLEGLDERLNSLPAERRARGTVLVLHMMGSHGPAYAKRSPPEAKKFLPECTTVNLQNCSREGLLNAYDNSIVYTDQVLGATIDWLKTQQARHDTALIYLSDHGESLGENNLFLHGMPYAIAPDVQKKIPWVTWVSPGFVKSRELQTACLRERASAPVSHDNLFHSLIGLMQVRTEHYRPAQDPYQPCMQANTQTLATAGPKGI
jgi:lipid A ethanolaminephosphotransferase